MRRREVGVRHGGHEPHSGGGGRIGAAHELEGACRKGVKRGKLGPVLNWGHRQRNLRNKGGGTPTWPHKGAGKEYSGRRAAVHWRARDRRGTRVKLWRGDTSWRHWGRGVILQQRGGDLAKRDVDVGRIATSTIL